MSGIFISRFVTLTLSGLSFSIDEKGKLIGSTPKALVHYDVCPIWLDIAVKHIKSANAANDEMTLVWQQTNNQKKGETLENVFQYSMQAITASAIAIDGFYAAVQQRANVDPDLIAAWHKNKTARFAQVSETIRFAYQLKGHGFEVLRDIVRQIYEFRDQAVHPSNKMEEAVLHSDLKVGVEKRLQIFRYYNAFQIVRSTVDIIDQLAREGKACNKAIKKYSESLGAFTEPLRSEPILNLPPLKDA